jgi:hypothetical protein
MVSLFSITAETASKPIQFAIVPLSAAFLSPSSTSNTSPTSLIDLFTNKNIVLLQLYRVIQSSRTVFEDVVGEII